MVFSSPLFLFVFLPVFLGIYYLLPRNLKIGWILLGSWVFYGLWRLDFLFLLVGVSLFNWLAGLAISRSRSPFPRHGDEPSGIAKGREESGGAQPGPTARGLGGKAAVAIAVFVNLAVLAYFKYANFGIEAASGLLGLAGAGALPTLNIILPVGISFYIFQALSYTVDVYRGHAPAAKSFATLSAYLALFPQLIAGPIVRYKDLADQLAEPHVSPGRCVRGIRRFVFGLAKKVLIADSLGSLVDGVYGLAAPSFLDGWFGLAAFSIQLYFDFSAYSDMAIGLGYMLGFRFRENFRQPYHAASITEFWQRWHISLSTWLRDYLYIPLGGNRLGLTRTSINLLIVMVLGGLWHGAAWTFVVWGLWHGTWLLVERRLPSLQSTSGRGAVLHRIRSLAIVGIGWVLFRSDSLAAAGAQLASLVGFGGWGLSPELAWQVEPTAMVALVIGIVLVILEGRKVPAIDPFGFRRANAASGVLATALPVLLLSASVLKLLADSYSPFLYFRF